MDICSSPKLFAAYHVFHRLLVPRHPPCALSSLTRCLPPRERLPTKKHSVASLAVCLLYLILSVCLRIFRYASDVLYLLLMKLFFIRNSQTGLLVSSASSNVQASLCASTKSACPQSDSFIEYLRFNLVSICSFQGAFLTVLSVIRTLNVLELPDHW